MDAGDITCSVTRMKGPTGKLRTTVGNQRTLVQWLQAHMALMSLSVLYTGVLGCTFQSLALVFPCSVNRVELAGGGDVYKQDRLGEQGCAFSTHLPHQKMDCSLA